ncbi:unnamed protein product [Amoebophrya sp. A120]|nr:unnamed protein product [Amoebophrya sp. A120]|eukprot:GSA120T00000524001.1
MTAAAPAQRIESSQDDSDAMLRAGRVRVPINSTEDEASSFLKAVKEMDPLQVTKLSKRAPSTMTGDCGSFQVEFLTIKNNVRWTVVLGHKDHDETSAGNQASGAADVEAAATRDAGQHLQEESTAVQTIEGGGVAGERISPECRFFFEQGNLSWLKPKSKSGDEDNHKTDGRNTTTSSYYEKIIELGCGHGGLAAWAAAVLKTDNRTKENVQKKRGREKHRDGNNDVDETESDANEVEDEQLPKNINTSAEMKTSTLKTTVIATDLAEFLSRAEATRDANENSTLFGPEPDAEVDFETRPLAFGSIDDIRAIVCSGVVSKIEEIPPVEDAEEGEDDEEKLRSAISIPRTSTRPSTRQQQPMLLLGAGITYWECLFAPLAETMEQFFALRHHEEDTALISYFRRNWSGCEKRFWTKILPRVCDVEILTQGKLVGEKDARIFAPLCTRGEFEGEDDWNVRIYRLRRKAQAGKQPNKHDCYGVKLSGEREEHEARSGKKNYGMKDKINVLTNEEKRKAAALAAKIAKEQAKMGKKDGCTTAKKDGSTSAAADCGGGGGGKKKKDKKK